MRKDIAQADEPEHARTVDDGQCPVAVLLHGGKRLAERTAGSDGPRRLGRDGGADGLFPVEAVSHALREHVAFREDAVQPSLLSN
jgi:hypothetical protein